MQQWLATPHPTDARFGNFHFYLEGNVRKEKTEADKKPRYFWLLDS
jgi:hypothetical protein